jgi:cytochrome c oxidase subunit 1
MMTLNGLSAIVAATGGVMYIVVVVGSILFGKSRGAVAPAPRPALRPVAAIAQYGSAGTLALPGTYILVGVFFSAFVLYYFVNWKYLSEVWPLS